ncbi:MAG: hypothetical protein A2675_01420 [Candidatus Yonathbacteria bacterium RIFCSPHIGHO2_01_FULL_51_10]|uniref:FAD dependent oxidoreductase domain-containing protein n=1 Tax=Candidatus Yonathbacteria bacterium RIFCSPHIGHO2_01_FULL_51_10 TaxID=1802723 RepID=A0A1G2S470_9BACT|nr:MAG: hypothetical protein A2675_01420 [Candidatus Yonathbacteria bacterium RIFCSPHIGHO2_01_FULL_51_10]
MRIAVVGGGIYGATIAIILAEAGYSVDLIERNTSLLMEASGINQYRLHRGYHYPRSDETIIAAKSSTPLFEEMYTEAIIKDIDHFYCIARERSLTNKDTFLSVCAKHGLNAEAEMTDLVNVDMIEGSFKVEENTIDPQILKLVIEKKLGGAGVRVLLGTSADKKMLSKYDFVVLATYANLGSLTKEVTGVEQSYQYELCEKPILRLPKEFSKKSLVVMDGPFLCIDSYGSTGLFVMGHVQHAIHHSNIGVGPEIPGKFISLLNKGVVVNPAVTNIMLFLDEAKKFFPLTESAEHVGSMFTVRTVLPNLDKTDARPTLVSLVDDKVVTVFAGKIGSCVQAAQEVLSIVKKEEYLSK